MKPLYLKIKEKDKDTFIKIVRNGSFATTGLLILSYENSWSTESKIFDLDKEKDKQDYVAFKERCLESNRDEFDEASKQVLKQADELRKKSKD